MVYVFNAIKTAIGRVRQFFQGDLFFGTFVASVLAIVVGSRAMTVPMEEARPSGFAAPPTPTPSGFPEPPTRPANPGTGDPRFQEEWIDLDALTNVVPDAMGVRPEFASHDPLIAMRPSKPTGSVRDLPQLGPLSADRRQAAELAARDRDLGRSRTPIVTASSGGLASDGATDSLGSNEPVHDFFRRYLDRKQYYVREGDTLPGIAFRLYGDEAMAERILEANRDRLRQSGGLRPGLILRLP